MRAAPASGSSAFSETESLKQINKDYAHSITVNDILNVIMSSSHRLYH